MTAESPSSFYWNLAKEQRKSISGEISKNIHYLQRFALPKTGKPTRRLRLEKLDTLLSQLQAYGWSGNDTDLVMYFHRNLKRNSRPDDAPVVFPAMPEPE